MNRTRLLLSTGILLLSFHTYGTRCGNLHTLTSDLTIDVNIPSSLTSVISTSSGTKTVIINHQVIIPDGITLKILGTSVDRLKLRIMPALDFVVEKGGILIIEYCDLESYGSCPAENPLTYTNKTWDGILVKGDPTKDHYDIYDLINGWDPYADPFKPGGTYKSNGSGGFAHGRLQMRWCTVKDIHLDSSPGPATSDDTNTEYLKENKYGNYAIRSTGGGILNIIDCDFEDVRSAILIDNYKQYATDDPNSKLMNAFQIVDCDFTVTQSQRSSTSTFINCIQLFDVQKVTLEGCTFTSEGIESQNGDRGTAIKMEYSSILMHKSGNFRRTQDFAGMDGRVNCPLYGNKQSNIAEPDGYQANHPWRTSTPRKCTFTGFYRGITTIGDDQLLSLYTLVVDNAIFDHNFFPIYLENTESSVISRCEFNFEESNMGFTDPEGGSDIHFEGSHSTSTYKELATYDRADITSYSSRNLVVTECSFSSDYNGSATYAGKTLFVLLVDQEGGAYKDAKDNYVYDLIYKCTFTPSIIHQDIGVWITKGDEDAYILMNCNDFEDLKNAIVIARIKTQLLQQFHYTDRKTGRNAPAKNTFTNNHCDLRFPSGYLKGAVTYYRLATETVLNTCGGSGLLDDQTSTETVNCDSMTCEEYPMTPVHKYHEQGNLDIYPNPSNNGVISIKYMLPTESSVLSVHDLSGKTIYTKSLDKKEGSLILDLKLDQGFYFVKLQFESQYITRKVLISQ